MKRGRRPLLRVAAIVGLGVLGAFGLYYWLRRRQPPVLERLAELKRQLQSD